MSLLSDAQRMSNACPTDSPDVDTLTRLIAVIHFAEALGHVFEALEPDECAAIPSELRGLILRLGVELEGRG